MGTTRSGISVNSPLSYSYDDLYRLIEATRPLPSQPVETFTYDPVGNRLLRDGQTTNAVFDNANRLIEDQEYTYDYDNNGNLVEKTNKSTLEVTQYTYDAENRLIQIDKPGTTATYRYDGLGQRIEKNVNGVITRYVYNNQDIILEFDGSNSLKARYTHGTGINEPLIMERGGVIHFYHKDVLGNITELTDATGSVVQSYLYDSFGNIIAQNGSVTNTYTYTGQEFDLESGLYCYRARYYDANIGRFLQEDPIGFEGGDINLYVYVKNNPINLIDPYGLQIEPSPERDTLFCVLGNFATQLIKLQIGNVRGSDKWYHCMANCLSLKRCKLLSNSEIASSAAAGVSDFKERFDCSFDPDSCDPLDQAANEQGRTNKGECCEDTCKKFRVKGL